MMSFAENAVHPYSGLTLAPALRHALAVITPMARVKHAFSARVWSFSPFGTKTPQLSEVRRHAPRFILGRRLRTERFALA